MRNDLIAYCEELKNDIKKAYESSVSLDEAEKLAAKFLFAQLELASALQSADLDARMRKVGLKAIRSVVYIKEASSSEKKPTEAAIDAKINMNELVQGEQNAFDQAEVIRETLQNNFNVFKEAHVFFRGISRGRFE